VFFKTSEPRAAKWISEAIGEIEVERLKESRSMGLISGKKSYALDIATKPLVMASEISGLEPLRAFIKRENQVVPVRFQLAKKRGRQPEFIERRMPTLALRPALSMPASPAELPRKPAQVSLPFSDPPAAQPQKVYVWDESKGID
jgi:type IV secretory pathway TraG/TraD family ATPase VirD4